MRRLLIFVLLIIVLSIAMLDWRPRNLVYLFALIGGEITQSDPIPSPDLSRVAIQYRIDCSFICKDETTISIFRADSTPSPYRESAISFKGLYFLSPRWDGDGRLIIDMPSGEDPIRNFKGDYDGVSIVFNNLPLH